MPVASIISQPISNQLMAAYRPVLVRAVATSTSGGAKPPVVYCDIYFGGIFYKTLSKTLQSKLNTLNSEWEFDIQDAAQEYLKKYIAGNGIAQIIQVDQAITTCFCKIRSSDINASGFIEAEGTAPVQGTSFAAPVSGTGLQSNSFFIVNATLQHEDNQDLSSHLGSFKRRTWSVLAVPLTHRPDNYKVTPKDSDYFPIVYIGDDLPAAIRLNYRFRNQVTWRQASNFSVIACPNVINVQIVLVNNGNGTQTITFTWDPLPTMLFSLTIGRRLQGSTGTYLTSTGSTASPESFTLPLGVYQFRFVTSGPCFNNPVVIDNVGIPNTPCTPVSIIGSPSLPDATVGQPYLYQINLAGSAPFTLSSIVKPGWMNIAVSGSSIIFSGTPDATATGLTVSMRINNCFTANHVDFSDVISVTEPNLNAVMVVIEPGLMDIGIAPVSDWQWTGQVTIRDSTSVIIATHTWSSHANSSQQEVLNALNLPDGTYSVQWVLQSIQNGSAVTTNISYIEDFGPAVIKNATDSVSVTVSGNSTKQIQLQVNNG